MREMISFHLWSWQSSQCKWWHLHEIWLLCKPHPWVGHAWSKTGWAPVTEVGAVVRETKSTTRCPGRKVGNESKDAVQLMKMKAEGINENEGWLRQFYFLKSLLWNLMLYIVNNSCSLLQEVSGFLYCELRAPTGNDSHIGPRQHNRWGWNVPWTATTDKIWAKSRATARKTRCSARGKGWLWKHRTSSLAEQVKKVLEATERQQELNHGFLPQKGPMP